MIVIRRFTDIKIAKKLVGSMYGYTIIEVIIFLTISTALFLSVSMMMSGRNDRTRFSQAVVDLDENLQDVFNDVSSGYYPSDNNVKCEKVSGTEIPKLTTDSVGQGSNSGCVFAGKLVTMPKKSYDGSGVDKGGYFIHAMVSVEDADFNKMNCTKLLGGRNSETDSGQQNPGVREERSIQAGLQVTKVLLANIDSSGNSVGREFKSKEIQGFASVYDFAGELGPNNSKTGNSSRVKLHAYGHDSGTDRAALSTTSNAPDYRHFLPVEGANKITICLAQDGNGRKAAIVISANMSTERFIDNVPAECS